MKKFKYSYRTDQCEFRHDFEKLCNSLGSKGWELINLQIIPETKFDHTIYLSLWKFETFVDITDLLP